MGQYKTAQVCVTGHVITGNTGWNETQDFCDKCGEKTITQCPACNASIRGHYEVPGVFGVDSDYSPPSFCHSCGATFPWTHAKIAAAIRIFEEFGNLSKAEQETISDDVRNLARDTAGAELSARRIRRIWERTGPLARNLLMELAGKTAAAQILRDS